MLWRTEKLGVGGMWNGRREKGRTGHHIVGSHDIKHGALCKCTGRTPTRPSGRQERTLERKVGLCYQGLFSRALEFGLCPEGD